MKDHIIKLRRKIGIYDWSLHLHTQLRSSSKTVMINLKFRISLFAVQIHDLSDINLHSSPSTSVLRTHKVTTTQMA